MEVSAFLFHVGDKVASAEIPRFERVYKRGLEETEHVVDLAARVDPGLAVDPVDTENLAGHPFDEVPRGGVVEDGATGRPELLQELALDVAQDHVYVVVPAEAYEDRPGLCARLADDEP